MFPSEMEEQEENQVTIEDIHPSIMELVIDFCYTQEISLNDKNYQDLLSAASRFLIKSLLDVIAKYFTILNPSNCLHILEISDKHNLHSDQLCPRKSQLCYQPPRTSACEYERMGRNLARRV